jgi:oligosaccharide reducing-end xylanase
MRFILRLLAATGLACGGELPRGAGSFATGQYRNLFVEIGHSAADVRQKLDAAFEQLFHGDPDTQAIYAAAGENANGPLAYVWDTGNNDVRSEGMSYGMMIAVQMDRKAEFDALWNWAKTYMYHAGESHPSHGYFSWSLTREGVANDESPAPDGEEYFVMALYFAAGRWGNGSGIYNYRFEADRLLNDMRLREPITGMTVRGERTTVAMFDAASRMVRFTPNPPHQDHTDASYHLPAFYELWARWGPSKSRQFWLEAAAASREFFETAAHPVTGLTPERSNFDGTPWAEPWYLASVDFRADACRTAMNWAVDWAWWGADERARTRSDRIQAFFESRGLATYGDYYTLSGTPLSNNHSTSLVSTNAVASLAATHPRWTAFVDELWNAQTPAGQWRYYGGCLYLMSLLHVSGEFRIWPPSRMGRSLERE